MSAIDDVIRRARQPGSFSQHKRFTLAREQAITKLRHFALPDPSHYVLELIQAAIANKAAVVHVWAQPTEVLFSYFGGHLAKDEMANLFDFLFASQDALGMGHLRSLALGINALMRFAPKEVVVESGDGTLAGTHRMVISPATHQVDVGRSNAAMHGTFVVARGLQRGDDWGEGERNAVETRCLAAPVPITFNGETPFGFGSHRLPTLWGFERVTYFDEGDLYGGLGSGGPESFRLLTYGVWIQSYGAIVINGERVGGIINFDRLRKTADHAALVQDARFDEMWLRVKPYALRGLFGEKAPSLDEVRTVTNEPIPPAQLRSRLVEHGRVLVVGPAAAREDPTALEQIAQTLGVPVLLCPGEQILAVRYLAGDAAQVITPLPDTNAAGSLSEVVHFYLQPEVALPPEPHITAPVVASFSVASLAKALEPNDAVREERCRAMLGGEGKISVTLFAPAEDPRTHEGMFVEIIITGRVAFGAVCPSPYRGLWMRISLPDVSPLVIRAESSSEGPLGPSIARVTQQLTASQQEQLNRRMLATLLRQPASSPMLNQLVLDEVVRAAVLRLRRNAEGAPQLQVDSFKGRDDLIDYPCLRTLTGEARSVRQVVACTARTRGLVYGVIDRNTADLHGLDTSLILDLTAQSERALITLLGQANYVRVDARDLLAVRGDLRVRDVALGLRPYREGSLLLEDGEMATLEDARSLLQQLVARYLGTTPAMPTDPEAFATWEENRRQACRHLQWIVCRQFIHGEKTLHRVLPKLPLFTTTRGKPASLQQVLAALRDPNGDADRAPFTLQVTHRPPMDNQELSKLAASVARGERRDEPAGAVAVSAMVAGLLEEVAATLRRDGVPARLRLAFDFDLPTLPDSDARSAAYAHSVPLSGPGVWGVLGLPTSKPDHLNSGVVIFDGSHRIIGRYDIPGHPQELRGYVVLQDDVAPDAVEPAVAAAVERAVEELVRQITTRLSEGAADADTASLELFALAYATKGLVLQSDASGVVHPTVMNPLAQAIFELPLFPVRDGRVSAWWLIVEFANYGHAAFDDANRNSAVRQFMASREHHLRDWVAATLDEGNVLRTRAVAPMASAAAAEHGDADLAKNIEYWLGVLRPETLGRSFIRVRLSRVSFLFRSSSLLRCRVRFPAGVDIDVNAAHPLVKRTRHAAETGGDPEALAWLLIAVYAEVNRALGPITNEHEWELQRRVLRWLRHGRLAFVAR